MQETINYNLKKPEANDNVNIDDLNLNFDIIDEKLFAVIQAWEKFKASGGEISGNLSAIQLATKSPSNNYRWTEETHNTGYKIISSNTNPSTGDWREEFIMAHDGFAPKNDKVLGTSENPWNDIFIKGVSKNTNGYTKLPNGFIMQWGQIDITISNANNGAITATLPIAFSTSVISFGAICSGNSFGWGNSDLIIGNAGCSNTTIRWTCSTRNGANVNGSVQVTWWVLGY